MLCAHDLDSAQQAFLDWLAVHNFSPETIRKRREQLTRFVTWARQRQVTRLPHVTPQTIEAYQQALFEHRQRNGLPLSVGVRRGRLTGLRVWFRWLHKQRLLLTNPAAELELPKTEKRLPRQVFTAAEVEQILAMASLETPLGLRDRAIMELFYSTAIRRKEIIGLSLADVDRPRRTLLIRQGKGKQDRVVPCGERALGWLDRYLAQARPQLLIDASEDRLFLSRRGLPLKANHLTALIRGYVRESGVGKSASCHGFRHATATLMLDGGADVRYVQALLGHAQLSTTQVYTQVSIAKLREVHDATHPASRQDPPEDEASSD